MLVPALLLASFGSLAAWAARDRLSPPAGVVVVPVVSRTVDATAGTVSFQAAGWLEPDPYPIQVSALADGIVREVLVLEGDRVEAGQVVARLVDDDAKLALAAAEAALRHREAGLARARATLSAAEREFETLVERERAIAAAEASLAEVQSELARTVPLAAALRAKVVELEERLERESRVAQGGAFAELAAIRTRHELAAGKATLEAEEARRPVLEAQARRHEAELRAARESRRLLVAETRAVEEARAGVAVAEADRDLAAVARDQAKLRLERMEIRSPAAGVVFHRMIAPGTKLLIQMDDPTSAHAVHLYDPSHLQVRVDVPLADAGHVSFEQLAEIGVEVASERVFHGCVTRILHQADIQKNSLQVKIDVHDPDPVLRPEMLARVRFLAAASAEPSSVDALFVPERAVRREGGKAWGRAVDEGRGIAGRRELTLGPRRIDDWVEVTEGLVPGDAVVVEGPADLEDGGRVRVLREATDGVH